MLLTSSWLLDLLLLIVPLTYFFYKYSTRKFDYWKKRGVPYQKPLPFFGNSWDLCFFKNTIGGWLKNIYDSTDEPYIGIFVFDEPYLVIKSPELIKNIIIKDFNHFTDRTVASPKHNEMIANMMFLQKSPDWKPIRTKMTPVFTSGKLKGMFPIINSVGIDLIQYLQKNVGILEAKDVCSTYSIEVITKCAFGINSHCFDNNNAEFKRIGRVMFDFRLRNAIVQTAHFFRQQWVNLLRLNFFDTWVQEYVTDAFWKTVKLREKSKNRVNDLVDILMDIMKDKEFSKEVKFEGDKVAAQAVQFFAAGFETTSSTIAYTLYEMAVNQNIQNKLRSEIISNLKENNGLTYDGLSQMKYMDMCIFETLRKYPVLPFLDRRCNADYKVPGTNFVIEKGLPVYIPMFGMHLDEKYFPEPQKYKPDRFVENVNTNGLKYIPFGEGPRNCIGERFGMLSVKMSLTHILSKFEVEKCPQTPIPVEFEPRSFVLQSKVGLPLRFKHFVPSPA